MTIFRRSASAGNRSVRPGFFQFGRVAGVQARRVRVAEQVGVTHVERLGITHGAIIAFRKGPVGGTSAAALSCDHGRMQRFIVTIEGAGWSDVEDLELSAPPREGEPIETKYGTCVVTSVEPPVAAGYEGKISCRLP